MPIADAWIDYSPKNTYLRAFIVGLVNTLRVAVIGIVLATVLGTIVGIARLSSNWLLSRLAAVYVEVLRDLPLLLQLLFWYVLMQGLPAARAAWMPIDGVYLSNRGLILPSIPIEQGNLWVIGAAVAGLIVAVKQAGWIGPSTPPAASPPTAQMPPTSPSAPAAPAAAPPPATSNEPLIQTMIARPDRSDRQPLSTVPRTNAAEPDARNHPYSNLCLP